MIKLEIDRLGVGLLSFSSGGPPSEVLELFLTSFGDCEDVGRWWRLVALEARLTVLAEFGEGAFSGDVAGCGGRWRVGVCRLGVAGAEERGVLNALLERLLERPFVWVACAGSKLGASGGRVAPVCMSMLTRLVPSVSNLSYAFDECPVAYVRSKTKMQSEVIGDTRPWRVVKAGCNRLAFTNTRNFTIQ